MGKKSNNDFNLELIPQFITFDEADKFIELIDKSNKIDSTIGVDGKVTTNNTRISQTVSLCDCDKIVIDLKKKVAKELDIPFNNIEPVQAQVYERGGKFDVHQDGFCAKNLIKFGLSSGNRVKTLMIYLNYNLEGGSTTFPNLNESFMPFTGTAIKWDNLNDFCFMNLMIQQTVHQHTRYCQSSFHENPSSQFFGASGFKISACILLILQI